MKEETFLDFLRALGVALLHSRESLQNLNAHMTIAPLLHNVKKRGGGGGGGRTGKMLLREGGGSAWAHFGTRGRR